eukprot:248455_1
MISYRHSTLSSLYRLSINILHCLHSRQIKYSINHQLLDNGLVSHEHAWFWGMVLTDATITCPEKNDKFRAIKWHQKYDSYNMLDKLRSIAGSDHPIIFDAYSSTQTGK